MLKTILSKLTFLIQLFSTAFVLFGVYMIYAVLTNVEFDMVTGIGFLLFQPLIAFVLISITLSLCLLLGLPLRKNSRLSNWWKARQVIPILGTGLALLFLMLSFIPGISEPTQVELDGMTIETNMPNSTLTICGWFMLAFSMLHFYPLALMESITKWFRIRHRVGDAVQGG